ncbi:helix-turn-helix domain-containing protein [Rhodococcus sp. T2V]|uniref:helix-turn-helix domain-containing protein n=1 Tax=Rhodococcus sp. T2V TaxID=3034164 RepID=UPI0034E2B604
MGPTERLVLVALAEWADADDRTCWRTAAELSGRIGISEEGLRKSIRKLATYGVDPRVPIAFKDDGSPVFAYRGRATTFRIPYLTSAVEPPPKGGSAVPPFRSSTAC